MKMSVRNLKAAVRDLTLRTSTEDDTESKGKTSEEASSTAKIEVSKEEQTDETFSIYPAKIKSSPRAAVIFSSAHANGFDFYELFEQFAPDMHRIYIRDPYDQGYDQGVSDTLTSWEDVEAAIRSALKDLGAKRVMTFGAGIGGYASLRLASKIDAQACFAISPQTFLDRRLPHAPEKPVAPQSLDLAHHVHSWSAKNAAIFFDATDFVDIFNVFRINWRGVDLFPIPGDEQPVTQQLLSSDALKIMLADFASKANYTASLRLQNRHIALDRACCDDVQRVFINRIVEGFYLDAEWDVLAHVKALKALGRWADGWHIQAKILSRKGDHSNAIKQAEEALSRAPSSVTISDSLAEIYYKAGNVEKAIKGYRRSLKLSTKHYQALCRLGELLAETGDTETATDMLRQAVEVRPRLNRAQRIATKLSLDV